jgi:hypothetical protein
MMIQQKFYTKLFSLETSNSLCLTAEKCSFSSVLKNQVKEDEMGRIRSTNWGEEDCIEDIGRKVRRKETTRKTKT